MTSALIEQDPRPTTVRVLGPLSLVKGGREVTPTSPKVRQLVGLLAATPGAAVRTELVADELWPAGHPQPNRNIQTHVWQLRTALSGSAAGRDGATPVRHTGKVGYSFDVGAVAVDVERFAALRERGDELLGSGATEEAALAFGRAVGLCRGPALEDVPLGPVLTHRRRHLEVARLAVLERCLHCLQESGRPEEVLGHLDRVLRERVTNEALYAHVIIAMGRTGQRSSALDLYQWVRRSSIDETGLEPGPVVRDAAQEVLREDRHPRPERRPGPNGDGYPTGHPPVTSTGRTWTTIHDVLPESGADRTDPAAVDLVVAGLARDPGATGRRVVRVAGPPRSGRTSVCLASAARLTTTFPDGVLHAELVESTPHQVLGRFLQAVTGGQVSVPAAPIAAARLWREVTRGRRLLVVVDGMTDIAQVPMFVPGSGHGAVLVSSHTDTPSEWVTHTIVLPIPADARPGTVDEITVTSVRRSLAQLDHRARVLLLRAASRLRRRRRLSTWATAASHGLTPGAAEQILEELAHFGFATRNEDFQGCSWFELTAAYVPVLAEIARRENPPTATVPG